MHGRAFSSDEDGDGPSAVDAFDVEESNPFIVLGITATRRTDLLQLGEGEIGSAYRKKAATMHPDK
eukprot:820657-Karenia_brevis.AAC.1